MQPDRYRWRLLGVVLVTMMSFGSATTILGVALGELSDDLGGSEAVLAWTVTGPFLALGVATPVLGKLGDIYGHRRLYLIGAVVFAAGSVASTFAWDAGSIIVFRAIAGLGGAAAFPTGQAMILANFPQNERARALGYFSVVATGAPALGLALSGTLIDWFGWRAVIGFYAGLALVGVVLAFTLIRPTPPGRRASLDVAGAATLGGGILAGMLALSLTSSQGSGNPLVIGLYAVGVVSLGTFFRVERRASEPILPLRFLRRRNFTFPLLSFFALNGPYLGGLLLLPLLYEDVFGYDLADLTPLLLLRPGALALSSPIGGWLVTAAGERVAAMLSTICITASMVAFICAVVAENRFLLLPGLVLSGMALGLGGPAHATSVAAAVGDDDLGLASGLINTAASLGSVVGSQILLIVLGDAERFAADDFIVPFGVGAGMGVLALLAALRFEPRSRA